MVDVNVAVPPVISRTKSFVSKSPFPLLVLNTDSEKVIVTVELSFATSIEANVGDVVSTVKEALVTVLATLPAASDTSAVKV